MGRVFTVCVNMWKRTLETGGNKVVFKKNRVSLDLLLITILKRFK